MGGAAPAALSKIISHLCRFVYNYLKLLDGSKPGANTDLAKDIDKAQNEYKKKYNEGIPDPFKESYVDYEIPSRFVQGENWAYAVAKFPSKGTIVFPYRRRNIARIGHMEKTFQKYLEEKLSDSKLLILGDCAIHPVDNYWPYEPDIAIVDTENPSIRIDIEVDEPYAAITNKPIHYIGCGDDFRDMNLNNLGWVVVRFTEYQVSSDMLGCTSFVAQLLHLLNPSKSLPKSLLTGSFPAIQKRWTEIEAKVMASEKVREKYLNYEFVPVGNDEKIKITDIKQTEREKTYAKLVKPLIAPQSCRTIRNTVGELPVLARDNYIQFFPKEHVYMYDGREQFTPVSSVISCFFEPFDAFSLSDREANKRHVSQGQVLEEWDAKGACSREVGTFMHQQIENYYNGGEYQQEVVFTYRGKYVQDWQHIKLEHEYKQFDAFLRNHDFKPFRTEWTIYDEQLKIAGTIDMIHKHGDLFDIYDWKRSAKVVDDNESPIKKNGYGKKGLGELNKIEDTSYWRYCIQQNMYRYILEQNYGIKVRKMYLVVFCKDRDRYSELEVPKMDEAIASIVKAWPTKRLQ